MEWGFLGVFWGSSGCLGVFWAGFWVSWVSGGSFDNFSDFKTLNVITEYFRSPKEQMISLLLAQWKELGIGSFFKCDVMLDCLEFFLRFFSSCRGFGIYFMF